MTFPIITAAYILMLLTLRQAKKEFNQFRDTHLNNGRKVKPIERKICICILCYVITWTPYCIVYMIEAFDSEYQAEEKGSKIKLIFLIFDRLST